MIMILFNDVKFNSMSQVKYWKGVLFIIIF